MGLGDFLGGVYRAVNDAAYKVTKAAGESVDTYINAVKPGGDIHPFGGSVEAINTTGLALEHPKETGTVLKAAGQLAWEHPDIAAKGAWQYAKSQATPDKLLETGIVALATAGVGAAASKGALGAAEITGEVSAASRASRLSEFGQGASKLDTALGTGEASGLKKALHPVNTFITQPIKDKAAQKILTMGGEAGPARQGLAMAVQGSGVQPKALSGLSEEAAGAQKAVRQLRGAKGRSAQFKTGQGVAEVFADPKKAATNFAASHKQEALDYASGHPQEVGEALQHVDQLSGGSSGGGGDGFRPVQTGGPPAEEPQPQSLSSNQFQMQPLQQPSSSQTSSDYATGRGFQANQGMNQVSQQGNWFQQRSPRTQALLRTAASFKSQKRFYEGPNREVFRGIDPNHDWRTIEMRDNTVQAQWHSVKGEKPGSLGSEADPSNMRQPMGEGGPKPALTASLAEPMTESMTSKAEPYMSVGEQPKGALNPAVPRTIQPASAPGSERKISAQQNRSAFFQSGSVFDRNAALPPLSQPMAPKRTRQREVLGV